MEETIMKKLSVFMALAAMTAMSSGCLNDALQEQTAETTVLNAGITQTKTVLDGVKVSWTSGDKIMVNGVESAALELTEPSATADFAFGASLQAPYSAVFPSSIYKDAATVTLPAQQEAAEGSFHAQASPMLAYGSEKNLVFAHPFAVVKVTVRMNGASSKIQYFEFRGNAGEQVCGDFEVDYSTLSLTGKAAGTGTAVRVRVDKAFAAGESCTAYIVVPAGTYEKGYTVRVVDGHYSYMEKSTGSARTLEKGQIRDMASFDYSPTGTVSLKKAEAGVRSTTPTLVWRKKLSDIAGIKDVLNVNGLAVSDKYVLLSENGNSNPVYLDALTGEKLGTFDASTITAVNPEYYATADDAGRPCFVTYADAAGEKMNFYVARSFTSAPELLYSRDGAADRRQGYKISVAGECVMGANICVPVYANSTASTKYIANVRVVSSNNKFVGTWQGPNINTGATQGWAQTWGTKCDAMMLNTDNYTISANARVLTTAGATRNSNKNTDLTLSTYNGSAFALTTTKDLENPGFKFSTALDYVVFNNKEYIVYNYVNSASNLSYGDAVRLIDMTADATLKTEYKVSGNHVHGAWFESGKTVANANCLGDVAFHVSKSGYYLYVYLVFAGGEVACYRYDCIVW